MKRTSLHFLFLLSALLLCASPALSQSVLVFPRVIAATGEYTGLAVSNPTPAAVSITFTAYQADGTMAAGTGVQNPVTLSIPAGGQLAKQYGEIFGGNGSFNGWVQASSASTGLTGYFLNGNTALTDLDGAATVGAASDLMLPIAIEDGVAETEVTIVNANSSAATATVTVYGLDGGVIQTTSVSVAGMGVIRQTLSSLMGAGDYSAASHIRIQSALPLNALDVVVNYLVDGSAIRRETVEVPGQPASSGESYILPQFVTGGGWLSLIGLANGGGVSQTVTLTAYQENGTLWPGLTANPVQVTLPANGGIRTTAAEMFGFPAGTLNTGWIQVQSPLGYLSAYVGYGNTTTPSFGLVPAAEASTAWKYGVFPQVAEGGGFFTGLTLVNPGQTAATINFYTMRPDGTTVGESTFTLGAGQRVGELFREVLPAALGQVGGWGYVRSSQPLVGVSLLGTENGYALANVPEQGPPADFQPAGQTTGAITGTVTANGQAVAGVEITLTGPVTATVTTDASGDYIFSQLPAGTYQVTAVEPGAQFVPAAISVTLTAQNVTGQNFVAGGLTTANAPVVNVLSPASVFAGTSTLNIRVLGGNFTPTSVVLLNGQALQTSFINAGELDAILPAAQLTTAQTVNLTVMTPPPGGGQSGTVGLVVNPVPNDPLIVGRAATGGNPAGVAVDAKRLHALVTNESSDTVSVIDLKTLTSVAAIGVGRSPAEGIAVDAARDIALVANPGTNDVSVIDLPTNTETKRISLGAGAFPLGIAIDDTVSRAFVANEGAGTVSVIDLNALAVVGTIAAGAEPSNVAVNTGTHVGLVTNRGSNTVTVFNTSTLAVTGQLNVGLQPRGIAVNPVTNQAVIANSNGGDAWVVNLATLTIVAKVPVGVGPTGVAIFPLTNTAMVTNSGVTLTQPNTGVAGSVSVINLAADTVSQQITVGASAFGIDVDTADQQVVVADYGSNDVTVVRIPNPVPQVTDVEPKAFPAGGGTFTITITGTGFLPTSVVTVNGQALPTTYVSATELQAQVSPDALNQLLGNAIQQQTSKGQAFSATSSGFTIGVSNPGPGGGNSPPNSGTGQIQATNAVPVLVSISPTSIQTGTGNLTLTLSGNNFNATSVVNFGGSQQPPTAVSATSMTVVIPQSSLSAGTLQVSVSNPAPGGGTSGAIAFQVNGQSSPAPTVSSVIPASIQAGSAATIVTVQGSGFVGTTTAVLGGVSGTVSGQTATFNLSAAVLANPGTLAGLITTPAPGGGTATFAVNVLNGPPAVTGFAPSTAVAGTSSITLSVAGTNFGSGSQITVAGTPVPTTFVSATQLGGTMSAGFLLHAGSLSIGVINPAPGGGAAVAANVFTVTAAAQAPTITGVSPSTVTAGQGITVTGTNFVSVSTILLNGVALPTTVNSTTQLTATIPAAAAAGAASISVQNPATSTAAVQTSAAFSITILNSVPVVSSVTPASGTQNTQISITVGGANFVNGATINFAGSPVTTTFVNTTTLSASVLVPNAGTVNVSVTNPGGATSNSVSFQSVAATVALPTVTGVSPSSAIEGSATPITVTGTNFVNGAVINFNGSAVDTTFVNATTLTGTVAVPPAPGSTSVSVTNPGGAVSNSITFQILATTSTLPTVTGVSPSSGAAGSTTSITVTGTNFINGAVINFNGAPTVTSFVNSTTLAATVTVPSTPGSVSVNVTNPGGAVSNSVTFQSATTAPTLPTVSGVSPSSALAGSSVAITVTGTNFISGAFINFNGASVVTTFVNSTTLTATVAVPSTPGPVVLSVTNQVGAVSNSITFQSVVAVPTVVTAISPLGATQGQGNISITLTGTNLSATTAIQFLSNGVIDPGITVTGVSASSDGTQVTATANISGSAALGFDTISISPSGTFVSDAFFAVNAPGVPTIYTLSQTQGIVGTTVTNFTITGASLGSVTGLSFAECCGADNGITVQNFSASANVITANLVIGSAALVGPHFVQLITTGNPGFEDAPFNVITSGGIAITGPNPALIHRGDTGTALTVFGANLGAATGIAFYNPDGTQETGITSSGFAASASSVSANLTVDPNMSVGPRFIELNFPGSVQIFSSVSLTVESQAAQGSVYVSSIFPSNGLAGSTLPMSLGGSTPPGITGFEFQVSGTNDTAFHVTGFQAGASQSSATLGIDNTATPGLRNLVLLPSVGGTLATNLTFNVVSASTSALSSLIPGQRVVNSGAFTMVVIGTGFTTGSGVTFNGTNYIAATTFIDSQHLSVNISGTDIASIGPVNVTVQVPDPLHPGSFLNSNTVVFNVVATTVTLSPNPVTIGQGTSFSASVALNQAVTAAGGVDVTLSAGTPGIISFPALAHINQGATVAVVTLTGSAIGTTSLTATYGSATSTITVNVQATAPATINVTPASIVLNAAGTDTITVTRVNAGTSAALTVTLNLSRTGYVNVPASVTIPATQTQAVVSISGIAPDPTPPVIVTASAAGLQSGTSTQISVQLLQLQMTPALLVNPGGTASLVITSSSPAPTAVTAPCVQAGLCVTLVSGASGIASVTSSVLIPQGQTQVTALVTGVNPGNTTVTATAPGGQAVSQIQVQNVNLSFVPGSATFFAGPNYAQTVTVIMSVAALSGGQTINLSSSDTTVATVPASITIPSGSTTVNATITGVGPGVATITAASPGLNNGTFSATVVAPVALVDSAETVRSANTGVRQQHTVNISNPAPIGGIPVTITSSAPAALLVAPCDPANVLNSSCTDTNSPQSAITLTIPTGQTAAYFDIVGQDIAQSEVRFEDPVGVVRDSAGNVYIADYSASVIRRIDGTTGIMTTFAGTGSNAQTGDNGPANVAAVGGPAGLTIYNNALYIACYNHQEIRKIDLSTNTISTVVSAGTLSQPFQVAFDSTGEMFIASFGNSRIYRLSPGIATGTLTVYAGGGAQAATTVGGAATVLAIGQPRGVAVDAQGNVYYSDYTNNLVNQIATNGTIARITGNGTCANSADVSDAAMNGLLCNPSSLAYDPSSGFLYISDRGNERIVRVTLNAAEPSATPRPFYRIAGSVAGQAGCCGDGLPSRSSLLYIPDGLSVDSNGNLLIGDSNNYRARQITFTTGIIETLAGGGVSGYTGDNQPALSNHLTITAPNFVTAYMPVNLLQSAWTFQNPAATETTAVPFSLVVRANNTNARMADATNVSFSSLPGGLFTPSTTPVTIPINGTSATFAVDPTGTGNGQIQISANINGNNTRFSSAVTPVITVLPVPMPLLTIDGGYGVQNTATGVRQRHAVQLPAAVTGTPVQLSVVSSNASLVELSKCFVTVSPGPQPTDDQNPSCNGQPAGAGVTLSVPVGQSTAYFDMVGLTAATSDTRLNYPADVAVDGNGAIYVADYDNYVVRKLSGGVLSTIAGNGNSTGSLGANALGSGMQPVGVTVDSAGNLYIASANGDVIYQVTPSGAISVIAGVQNNGNFADGALGTGKLNSPYQVAIGTDGSLYIADYNNRRVRKIASTTNGVIPLNGTLTTIAGGGATTPAAGLAATAASLGRVTGVAVDPVTNEVYFSDYDGQMVWKLAQSGGTAGQLVAIAGTGTAGYNGDQADATQAELYSPQHLSIHGNFLYIADQSNHRIRKVTTNLTPRPLVTVAGTTSGGFNGDGNAAIVSELEYPIGVTTDSTGNLYIADQYNQRIREVLASNGTIETVIGDGNTGYAGDGLPGQGVTVTASVTSGGVNDLPVTIGVDVLQSQWRITSISGGGTTQTTGSTFTFTVQTTNSSDRMAAATTVNAASTAPSVFGIQTTPLTMPLNTNSVIFTAQTQSIAGNGQLQIPATGTSFLASTPSAVITVLPVSVPLLTIDGGYGVQNTATGVRQRHAVQLPAAVTGTPVQLSVVSSNASLVELSKCFVTVSPGPQPTDDQNPSCNGQPAGAGVTLSVPVGQSTAYFDMVGLTAATSDTRLNYPADVAVDGNGAIYVADYDNYVVRKLSGGVLSTIAGNGNSTGSLGANALGSGMQPVGVTVDSAGNLYIASANGDVIYQVTPSGAISVIAGVQNNGNFADGALGTGKLNSPYQVAIGTDGSLYIADYNNRRVRKIASTTNGVIPLNGTLTTIAGGGATTPAAGLAATTASLGRITGVAVDPVTNEVYFSDYDGQMVWKLAQSGGTAGQLVAIAGTGTAGYNGDQADATQAELYSPQHLSIHGNFLYIADQSNHRIRQVTTNLTPRPLVTVAGTTSGGFNGDGNAAIVSELEYPIGVTTDSTGNLYIADQYNQRIREVLASNGTIETVIGDGNTGYAGDGLPGQGVTVTASVTSGGVNDLPVTIGVDVLQSQWRITSISGGGTTQTTGSTFTFTVQTTNSSDRMAAATTVNAASTAPSVFGIQTTPLTMPLNTNSVIFTAQTQSIAGNGQLQIPATGTSFLASTPSAVITVLPVSVPLLTIDGGYGVQNTATGVRQRHAVQLPATVTGTPVQLNLVSSNASLVGLSKCFVTVSPGPQPTDDQNGSCNGQPAGAGVTLSVPVGQSMAYFDMVGLTSATSDTRLNYPADVAVDGNGAIYVADYDNYVVRKLSGGVLSTIAGNGNSTGSLGANALGSGMQPVGVTVDSAGNLYIASANGDVIYQVTPSGAISVIAGVQNNGNFADGALGTGKLNSPYQVAIGTDGSLYIADYNNRRVRKIASTTNGVIPLNGTLTTIAGGGATTPAAGLAATAASLGRVTGVAVDPVTNEVYFSDYDGQMVWKLAQSGGTAGQLVAIAGTGTAGYNGDQADATQAELYSPQHLSIHGNFLYIADQSNHRIRQVTTNLTPRPLVTVAGTTSGGFNGDGNVAIVSELEYPLGVTTDSTGNLYIADQYNQRIREVLTSNGTIQTVIGDGTAGYAGDGLPGEGVTITASVTSGGVNDLPVTIEVDVAQSSWQFFTYPTSTTGPNLNFSVEQTSSAGTAMRMNSSTSFGLTPNSANVLSLPSTLTIPNNGTSVTTTAGSSTTIGSGNTQIIAQASATGIALGVTSNITVTPVFTSVTPSQGSHGATTPVTITGGNLLGATGITGPAGITATITNVSNNGQTLTANIVVGSSVAPGAQMLTILTPTGNVNFTFTVQ